MYILDPTVLLFGIIIAGVRPTTTKLTYAFQVFCSCKYTIYCSVFQLKSVHFILTLALCWEHGDVWVMQILTLLHRAGFKPLHSWVNCLAITLPRLLGAITLSSLSGLCGFLPERSLQTTTNYNSHCLFSFGKTPNIF